MVLKKENFQGAASSVIGRIVAATAALLFLLLLGALPLRISGLGDIRPLFILIAVYYWSLTRPHMLSLIVICLMGILFDLLAAYPLGITALALMAVHWLVTSQRKYLLGQSFRVVWAGMAIVAFSVAIVEWLLFSLLYGDVFPLLPVLISALVTTALFPVFVPLLSRVNKLLADHPSEG